MLLQGFYCDFRKEQPARIMKPTFQRAAATFGMPYDEKHKLPIDVKSNSFFGNIGKLKEVMA